MLNCRGRNRIISIQSAVDCCCTINCNWILDTSNRTFNKAHTKWLLLDFYLLAIPMSGFQLLIECCRIVFFAQKKREIEGRLQSGDSPSATINWCDFNQVIFSWRSFVNVFCSLSVWINCWLNISGERFCSHLNEFSLLCRFRSAMEDRISFVADLPTLPFHLNAIRNGSVQERSNRSNCSLWRSFCLIFSCKTLSISDLKKMFFSILICIIKILNSQEVPHTSPKNFTANRHQEQ